MQATLRWNRWSQVLRDRSDAHSIFQERAFRHTSSVPQHVRNERKASGTLFDKDAAGSEPNHLKQKGGSKKNGPQLCRPLVNQQSPNVHNDREIIIPHSLSETLQAHQRANKESVIIRHTRTTSPPNAIPPRLRNPNPVQTIGLHLNLLREGTRRGRAQWEEYEGKIRPLSLDWEIVGDVSGRLRAPWLNELSSGQHSRDFAAMRLNAEIKAADLFFSPSQAECKATDQAIKDLESFVLRKGPSGGRLDVIGSRASGLVTPLSDLDLNLVVEGSADEPTNSRQTDALRSLFKSMRWHRDDDSQFTTSYFAAAARIPIIVGLHASGLEFQIQSASSGYGSLEVVKCLCAEYPTVKALFKIIKQALKMRGLADGAHGGLTSYPLINMIAVSIKKHAARTNPVDAGKHLLQFLQYWSTIDLYKTGITHIPSTFLLDDHHHHQQTLDDFFADTPSALHSIDLVTRDPVGARPVEFDVRKSLPEIHTGQHNFMMTLHDPANPYNDLGRSAATIKHIQATFLDMHAKLRRDISAWDSRVRAQGDAGEQPPSLLRSLIEGDYTLYNMERKRLVASR